MAQQLINIGTVAGDGTGDDLRAGGDKINDNFTELYNITDPLVAMSTAKLLGRTTASSGAVEEIGVGSGLSLTGGLLSVSPVDIAESSIVVEIPAVNIGNNTIVSQSIPTNRLYGISISLDAINSDTKVELLGLATSDVQYVGNFTSILLTDLSQAWRFRDRTATTTIRVRVTNMGSANLNPFNITIVSEPF